MESLSTSNSAHFIPVSCTEPSGGTTKTEASITPLFGSRLTGGSGGSGVGTTALERRWRRKDIMRDALKFDSDCSAFTGLTSSRVKPCAEEPPLSELRPWTQCNHK